MKTPTIFSAIMSSLLLGLSAHAERLNSDFSGHYVSDYRLEYNLSNPPPNGLLETVKGKGYVIEVNNNQLNVFDSQNQIQYSYDVTNAVEAPMPDGYREYVKEKFSKEPDVEMNKLIIDSEGYPRLNLTFKNFENPDVITMDANVGFSFPHFPFENMIQIGLETTTTFVKNCRVFPAKINGENTEISLDCIRFKFERGIVKKSDFGLGKTLNHAVGLVFDFIFNLVIPTFEIETSELYKVPKL